MKTLSQRRVLCRRIARLHDHRCAIGVSVAGPLVRDVFSRPPTPSVERSQNVLDLLRRAIGLVMHFDRSVWLMDGASDLHTVRDKLSDGDNASLTKRSFMMRSLR